MQGSDVVPFQQKQFLAQKLRPNTLDEIYGNEGVVSYFKAVVSNPREAHRNYLILGPYGCGKTSLALAFHNDLNADLIEVDSTALQSKSNILNLLDYVFQATNKYKVVIFDEFHSILPDQQQAFLKPIEDSTEPIFFFFVSTEEDGILSTIKSRCLTFNLEKYSHNELSMYLDMVLEREGKRLSDETKRMLIFRAKGHIRDLLNQLEVVFVSGEDYYKNTYKDLNKLFESYFVDTNFSIDLLLKISYNYLKEGLEFFIFDKVVRSRSIFDDREIVKLFQFYIRMKKYILNENDFYSFLILFRDFFKDLKKKEIKIVY